MKFGKLDLSSPRQATIYLKRGGGFSINLMVQMVRDYKPFELMCPEPKPPRKEVKGIGEIHDTTDSVYVDAVNWRDDCRTNYMCLHSLACNPELIWETVVDDKPETWANWKQEMLNAQFSHFEINYLIKEIYLINGLDLDLINKARSSF